MSSTLITPGLASPDNFTDVRNSIISSWTTVADASTTWNDVAWSPDLSLFARVKSSGFNNVETSTDGISWTPRTSTSQLNGVVWSPELNLFLAVGTNVVATSPLGTTWTSATETGDWNDVSWSSELGLFFIVGNGEYATSPDGTNFTTVSATGNWVDVAWSPNLNLFLTIGSAIRATFDGSTFTTASETGTWIGVDWSNELEEFLIIGTNVRATSDDGTSFTTTTETGTWNAVVWAPQISLFQVVGNNVRATFDGTTFTTTSETGTWNSVDWSPELNVFSVAGTNAFMYNVPSLSSYVQSSTNGTRAVTDVTISGDTLTIGQHSRDITIGQYASGVTIGSPGVPISIGGSFMGISYVREEQPLGTSGGTYSSAVTITRVLNKITNYGNIECSLDSNQMTLGPGKYIVFAQAPSVRLNRAQTWLLNVTPVPDEIVLVGCQSYSSSSNFYTMASSRIEGDILILTESSVLELKFRAQTAFANGEALGVSSHSSMDTDHGIFSSVTFYRLF